MHAVTFFVYDHLDFLHGLLAGRFSVLTVPNDTSSLVPLLHKGAADMLDVSNNTLAASRYVGFCRNTSQVDTNCARVHQDTQLTVSEPLTDLMRTASQQHKIRLLFTETLLEKMLTTSEICIAQSDTDAY